jgi:hypothetical protein
LCRVEPEPWLSGGFRCVAGRCGALLDEVNGDMKQVYRPRTKRRARIELPAEFRANLTAAINRFREDWPEPPPQGARHTYRQHKGLLVEWMEDVEEPGKDRLSTAGGRSLCQAKLFRN